MKAYALPNGSETSLFLSESEALAALNLIKLLGLQGWRIVELVEALHQNSKGEIK